MPRLITYISNTFISNPCLGSIHIYTYMWNNIMEPKQVGTHERIDGLKELSIHGKC